MFVRRVLIGTVCFIFLSSALLAGDDSAININSLEKLIKDKDKAVAYTATAQLAAYYRREGYLKKAEKLLKDFSSPSGFDSLPAKVAIPYLRCLLENAHIKALQKDIPGSLQLLNWAERRKHDYERAFSCLKYAEILLDLNESERARAYLKNVNAILRKHVSAAAGGAIGQGSKTPDTQEAWRTLRGRAAYLALKIEEAQLTKKFGATYASYVKLRRLQKIVKHSKSPRYFNEAIKLCDEIAETDPQSQFAAAAAYLKGQLLLNNPAEDQKKAIKDTKDHLEKFIKSNPEGLYRGEAMMLLGKISLEKEWNAKDAEKYYSQAFNWFKRARESRDAMSLYAPMSNDLKTQIKATQKPTTLDKWKRTVYHEEDPLRLYNTASSPPWYVSDKEKNCVFVLGLVAFSNQKYDVAKQYWELIKGYSPETAIIDPRLPVTVHKRLIKSCRLKAMAFWPEEKDGINNKNTLLKIQYAEYLILIAKYDDAIAFFNKIYKETDNDYVKAVCLIGKSTAMTSRSANCDRKQIAQYYSWILKNKKLKKRPIYGKALMESGYLQSSRNGMEKVALPFFIEYCKLFPNGKYYRASKFKQGVCYLSLNQLGKARQIYQQLKLKDDIYSKFLYSNINKKTKKGDGK